MATIAVIGAGIVGASCALFLQRDGHEVVLIDPEEPGTKTSYGNACSISAASIMPTATPGITRKIPGMLMDPAGPLNIRWRYLPRLAPFLLALLRNTTPERSEANGEAIANLVDGVMPAYATLLKDAGVESMVRRQGSLKVFRTEASFNASRRERDLMTKHGFSFDVLNSDELRQLEPGLRPMFERAIYTPDSATAVNPGRMVLEFTKTLIANGGSLLQEKALGFEVAHGKVTAVRTTGAVLGVDNVVLAAGPWSRELAKDLGASLRLDAERGYHVMLKMPETPIRRFVLFADEKFVLVPHEDGLRLTSGVEYAKVDAPPDYRRIRNMIALAAGVVPDLDQSEQSIWCGNRPTLPDSVPVIDRSPRYANAFLAFGHSHLGLTLGPVTGRIIADLVAGRDTGLDLSPYRALDR
ncbi:MAG: FAD-dependent oxidoreductase [Alphaproteobacteria bacterium]|nr:FAD-dependent oxidoreductase [Alphaproteobacteria bacterium]